MNDGPNVSAKVRMLLEDRDDFEELLRAYGIVELQRTGRVALPKLIRDSRVRAIKRESTAC